MYPCRRSGARLAVERACGLRPRRCGCFLDRRGIGQKNVAHASVQQRPDVLRRALAGSTSVDLDPSGLISSRRPRASHEDAAYAGRAAMRDAMPGGRSHGQLEDDTFTAGWLSGIGGAVCCSMGHGCPPSGLANRFSRPSFAPAHRR